MNGSSRGRSSEFNLFVFQVSCVAIVVVAVIIIKFIGGSLYEDVRNWYIKNFNDETKISDVIPEDSKSEEILDTVQLQQAVLPTINTVITTKADTDIEYNSLKSPLKYYTVTSKFGYRTNPITKNYEFHKGLDMATDKGTGISSVAAGRVELVKNSVTYGKYIKIDHGNGIVTLYAHCNSILKKEGDKVYQGEKIATVGSTGQSTGNHLHFEVILNGKNQNPEWLLSR